MFELFPFIFVFIAVIFFFVSTRLKGEWESLQFLFLFLGFMFIIISTFMIGILASGQVAVIGFQVMWLMILILIIVLLFFILFFLRNTLEAMSR